MLVVTYVPCTQNYVKSNVNLHEIWPKSDNLSGLMACERVSGCSDKPD